MNMVTRRNCMKLGMGVAGGLILGGISRALAMTTEKDVWFMPDESATHQRTWMAFGPRKDIWGEKLLPEVQRNLATIALTIAKYEPVSMLVRHTDRTLAKQLLGSTVELLVCPLDDIWMRDTGPVFVVTENGNKAGIDFNFNGWGKKQECDDDARIAAFLAQHTKIKSLRTSVVMEGGGIEVDGHGTAIITESCVLNDNRNPGLTKIAYERELMHLLGLDHIIWLPGIKGKDITDGHTDFYARFARPGVVVAGFDPDPTSFDHAVTKRHVEILRAAKDAQGRRLEVVMLEAPSTIREKFANPHFAAGYINFYLCNGAVIAPEFGDSQADAAAKQQLTRLFPGREIVQINIDGIAAGGGGIHCTTQQEPMV